MSVENELGFKSTNIEIIPAGEYDAVIHGIINLGTRPGQEQTFTNKDTGLKETKTTNPAIFLRMVLELPNEIRNDGQTHVIAKAIKLSDYVPNKPGQMESAFYKLLKVLGETPTKNNIVSYMSKDALSKFAGRALVATIVNKTSINGTEYAAITDLAKLHAKVEPPVPVREFFYFNPRNPDMEVFNNVLTYWTQKDIMSALDVDTFPKELHAAWAKIQEDKSGEKTPDTTKLNTESIE